MEKKKSGGKRAHETAASRALKPTAEEFASESGGMGRDLAISGKRVAKAIEVATRVLTHEFWSQNWSQLKTTFIPSLKTHIDKIPEDRFQDPPLQLAAPLIEQAAIAQDEPELIELCAKLLASAVDSNTSNQTHPAMASIVRELSPVDVRILAIMQKYTGSGIPIMYAQSMWEDGSGYHYVSKNLTVLTEEIGCTFDLTQYSIDNLCRLGLLEKSFTRSFTNDAEYEGIRQLKMVQTLIEKINKQEGRKANLEKGILSSTDFGTLFSTLAISSPQST